MNIKIPFFLALATAVLFAGCSPSQKKEVVVYTSVDQVYSEPLLKEFEKSTGIKVKAVYDVEASKTVGLTMRLEAEKDAPQADVFWNNEFLQTLRLDRLGLFAPISDAPARTLAEKVPQKFRCPSLRWVGLGGRARVFLVNTSLVPPDQFPRSLDSLLSPAISPEKTGMALPLFGTTATQAAALFALEGKDAATEFFSAVKKNGTRFLPGNSTVRDLVVSGELFWGLTDSDDAQGAIERGAPVAVVAPDQQTDGTFVVFGTVAPLKNSRHPEEAARLIEFLLSQENSLVDAGAFQWPLASPSCPMFPDGLKTWDVAPEKILDQYQESSRLMREMFVP